MQSITKIKKYSVIMSLLVLQNFSSGWLLQILACSLHFGTYGTVYHMITISSQDTARFYFCAQAFTLGNDSYES